MTSWLHIWSRHNCQSTKFGTTLHCPQSQHLDGSPQATQSHHPLGWSWLLYMHTTTNKWLDFDNRAQKTMSGHLFVVFVVYMRQGTVFIPIIILTGYPSIIRRLNQVRKYTNINCIGSSSCRPLANKERVGQVLWLETADKPYFKGARDKIKMKNSS